METFEVTIQGIIDAAEQIAVGLGTDPHQSLAVDSEMTAEDLLPLAIRHAYKMLISSGEMRLQDVIREHFIELDSNQRATLPDGVLTEHLDQAFLPYFP